MARCPSLSWEPCSWNANVEVMRGDVCRRQDWVSALCDVASVVHLAAETGTGQSMYRIGDYTSTNVLGTALLLDVLANDHHQVTKVLLASSRSVYGEGTYRCAGCGLVYPPIRSLDSLQAGQWEPLCPGCCGPIHPVATPETARTSPASVYAATKLAQEDLVRIAANALGIPFLIFRLQNVYGEGQSLNNPYTGILSIFSNRIRQGKVIALFEDGQESRDFVHVSDVSEAMALGLESDGGDGLTMNVGSGVQVTVDTVARTSATAIRRIEHSVGVGSVSLGGYPPQFCGYFSHWASTAFFAQCAAGGRHRAFRALGKDATHTRRWPGRRLGAR